jgi:hypothetical protein
VMIENWGTDYLRESGMELHIKLRYVEIIAWDIQTFFTYGVFECQGQ